MRDSVVNASNAAGALGMSGRFQTAAVGARWVGVHRVPTHWLRGPGAGTESRGHLVAAFLADTPSFTPTGGGPGSGAIQELLNWGGWFALVACLAGLMIGAAMWAHSASNGSYGGVHRGKQYVMGGAIGALVLGVAPLLISTLFTTGGH